MMLHSLHFLFLLMSLLRAPCRITSAAANGRGRTAVAPQHRRDWGSMAALLSTPLSGQDVMGKADLIRTACPGALTRALWWHHGTVRATTSAPPPTSLLPAQLTAPLRSGAPHSQDSFPLLSFILSTPPLPPIAPPLPRACGGWQPPRVSPFPQHLI